MKIRRNEHMKTTLDQIAEISIGASISRYSKKYEGEKQKIDVLYCTVDEFYTRERDIAKDIDSKYLTQKGDVIFKLSEPQVAVNIDENSDTVSYTHLTLPTNSRV